MFVYMSYKGLAVAQASYITAASNEQYEPGGCFASEAETETGLATDKAEQHDSHKHHITCCQTFSSLLLQTDFFYMHKLTIQLIWNSSSTDSSI